MKKVLLSILLLFLIVLSVGCIKIKKELNISLMDYEEYKEIDPSKVNSIKISRYTEGGNEDDVIDDKDEILRTYNGLKNKTLLTKTEMSCEDNTTIYIFITDDKDYRIEIECNILVHNKDRYLLK